jgi:hypothetical protein
MLNNHKPARHIADASFGEIRRQLDYKTGWNSGQLAVADRWFPVGRSTVNDDASCWFICRVDSKWASGLFLS